MRFELRSFGRSRVQMLLAELVETLGVHRALRRRPGMAEM
jgi:hypothetical protein